MPTWSVDIVPGTNAGDPATFVAQNQPSAPASPPQTLYTDPGDVVSWNNTTGQDHCISLLADPNMQAANPNNPGLVIPRHQTSAFAVSNGGTVAVNLPYTCLIHPNEIGTIQVS